jgi:molecular chaperone DnaK
MSCGKTAIEKAKLTKDDLDGILLVGGSCRIPKIQEELIKNFGDKLIKNANLDLAVAEGAAIQANILSGGASDILLLDVTPLRLGIETMGGVMTTLIEANTTIPCSKEQIFSTATDNQTAVTINVLQGERPMAKDNKQIGLFNLDGIMPARRGIPQIKVKFDIDANGILSVSATDNATGKEQHITIESKNSISDEEIERIKAEAKQHEEEDKKTREKLEKANKCEGLIYSTEQSLESLKDKVTDDDVKFFNEKLEELKKMKESDDYSGFDNIEKEVQARWHLISAKAHGKQGEANGPTFENAFTNGNFADMFGGMQGTNNQQGNDDTVEVQDAK